MLRRAALPLHTGARLPRFIRTGKYGKATPGEAVDSGLPWRLHFTASQPTTDLPMRPADRTLMISPKPPRQRPGCTSVSRAKRAKAHCSFAGFWEPNETEISSALAK